MSSIKTIELHELQRVQQQQLLELFAEADFADLADGAQWLNDAVKGSLLAIGAVDEDGQMIGFARVLGDGVSDCYIQDVVVKSSCRGQGIGKMLVSRILELLQERDIDWVGLIATPGKAGFYQQLGFECMEGFTPMKWNNNKH